MLIIVNEKGGKMTTKEYHILSLSGGKDSTALAFFMKENMPEIFEKLELVFCDTECELPETYDYLNKIEVFLNKKITRIKPEKSFEHLYSVLKILPSVNRRWCTPLLKANVFKNFIKKNLNNNSRIYLYIGIRSDESFRLKNAQKNNNKRVFEKHPFVDFGIIKTDVEKILKDVGINYPDYYKWRKRSGCYFCFYQSPRDWLNLYKYHPNLYQKAMEYEFEAGDDIKKNRFGWNTQYSLKQIIENKNSISIKNPNKENIGIRQNLFELL